jgi:uncharacterized repeat protein (TIGR03803 family)
MRSKPFVSFASTAGQLLALVLAILVTGAGAAGVKESVIHAFRQTDGSQPLAGFIADDTGNLYGTTSHGGNFLLGTVFELSPGPGGTWSETILYAFQGQSDGSLPYGTLVVDKTGNLYGIAQAGDVNARGEVFELTKGANGTWTESVIYRFTSSDQPPNGDLTWDSNGNLYGTTPHGGKPQSGEVFELSPQPDGSWEETVLYVFPGTTGLGDLVAGVTFDDKGNLYGAAGGSNGGEGGVYEISPQQNGQWTATVLHNFTGGADGGYPDSKLVFDANGNLYGTTNGPNYGEVFELIPSQGGVWTEQTLHNFVNGGSDGLKPQGTIVFDANGNLYGTTPIGGVGCNQASCGTVYRLSPQAGGVWEEMILHHFESASDGSLPQAGLFLDNAGHLFGTTKYGGGRYGYGTVFEISK